MMQYCQTCSHDRRLLATLRSKDTEIIRQGPYIVDKKHKGPTEPEHTLLANLMKLKHHIQQHGLDRSYHAFFRREVQNLLFALEDGQTPDQIDAMDTLIEAYETTRYDPDNHRSDDELAPARAILADYGLWKPIDLTQPYSGINLQNRMHNELKPVRFATREEFEAVNERIERQADEYPAPQHATILSIYDKLETLEGASRLSNELELCINNDALRNAGLKVGHPVAIYAQEIKDGKHGESQSLDDMITYLQKAIGMRKGSQHD